MNKEIESFLAFKQINRSPKTITTYRHALKTFEGFVEKPLRRLDVTDVIRFKIFCDSIYAPKTTQLIFNVVHCFITYCIGEGEKCIKPNRIPVPIARAKIPNVATENEFQQMLSIVRANDPNALQQNVIIRMLYDTGMRVGEIVSMNLQDVAGSQAVIHTEKTKMNRAVFWSQSTQDVFEKYLAIRTELSLNSDAVFVGICRGGMYSKRLTTRSVERSFKEICKRASIERQITPHSFRHSRIQRWLDHQLSLVEITQLSGHRSITSLEHYTRLTNKQLQDRAYKSM